MSHYLLGAAEADNNNTSYHQVCLSVCQSVFLLILLRRTAFCCYICISVSQSIGAVVSVLATSSPAPGSIPGGDRVFRALTDHTVPSDQDLK